MRFSRRARTMCVVLSGVVCIYMQHGLGRACENERSAQSTQFVCIEGTTFTMGSPLGRRQPGYYEDERPMTVAVSAFHIGKYLVTAAEYCEFLNDVPDGMDGPESLYRFDIAGPNSAITHSNGRFVPRNGAARSPVQFVTWKGAVLYCRWISIQRGKTYRLPTEAEWELAARGKEGRLWPWGDEAPSSSRGLIYDRLQYKSGDVDPPVGSYPANATPEGVFDMLCYYNGEWCANVYSTSPSPCVATTADMSVDLDSARVLRGFYRKSAQRYEGRIGRILAMTEYGWKTTDGRVWTRNAERPTGYAGFRIVEE